MFTRMVQHAWSFVTWPKKAHVTQLVIQLRGQTVSTCVKLQSPMLSFWGIASSSPIYLDSISTAYSPNRSLRSSYKRRLPLPFPLHKASAVQAVLVGIVSLTVFKIHIFWTLSPKIVTFLTHLFYSACHFIYLTSPSCFIPDNFLLLT